MSKSLPPNEEIPNPIFNKNFGFNSWIHTVRYIICYVIPSVLVFLSTIFEFCDNWPDGVKESFFIISCIYFGVLFINTIFELINKIILGESISEIFNTNNRSGINTINEFILCEKRISFMKLKNPKKDLEKEETGLCYHRGKKKITKEIDLINYFQNEENLKDYHDFPFKFLYIFGLINCNNMELRLWRKDKTYITNIRDMITGKPINNK